MKKIIALLISIILVLSAASCGKKEEVEVENDIKTEASTDNKENDKKEDKEDKKETEEKKDKDNKKDDKKDDKKEDKKDDKPASDKPEGDKSETTSEATKPSQSTQTDSKPTETVPAVKPDSKPSENKPAENKPAVTPENKPAESKPEEKPVENKPAENKQSVGNTLLADFNKRAGSGASAQAIADGLMSNSIIPFMGAVTPVEPGCLSGFGNTEIKGFSEGYMFGPAIGAIPFVGYVFTLDAGTDAGSFMQTLKSNADLRWNICSEADEAVSGHSGNKVFFVMCPKTFEE